MNIRIKEFIAAAVLGGAVMASHAALVGEWKFDGDANNTAPTGGDYNGTIHGSATFVTGHDGTGQALDFKGIAGNYVSIPIPVATPSFLSTVSNEISISFWALSSATGSVQTAAFQGSVGGTVNNREIQSHLPWGTTVYWDCGYDRLQNGGIDQDLFFHTGEWVYWVFTKNATAARQKVFANGKEIMSGTGTNDIDGAGITAFTIGSKVDGTLSWPGAFDDFKIYDHELTAEEIGIGFDPNILSPKIVKNGTVGQSPFEVIFDGSQTVAGQGVVEYLWDFGLDPSNVVISATGPVVTNIFTGGEIPTTTTITMYVVDGLGVTNSTTTTIKVVPANDPHEIIDLVAITNVPISSEAFYGTSITNLLNDPFNYYPTYPTESTPDTTYQQGFHGNDAAGADIWLSFTNAAPYTTVADYPVIAMDVWGRAGYGTRDDDFDVILYNGSWEDADKVPFGSFEGAAVGDSNYVRVMINTLPVGTTFDRVRIVGHNTSGGVNNPFTLTEIRFVAVEGEIKTVVAKVSADPVSGYYPLDVAFAATNSFATFGGTITDYLWDFGDGNTDSGVQVSSNTYAQAGVFTNTLTVVDNLGDTNSATVVISAINPIYAAFSMSTNMVSVGIDVYFDASASTNAVADELTDYLWDFGDGTTASGVTVTNSFNTGGTNTVTLTVNDAAGRSNSKTAVILLLAAPSLSLNNGMLSWDTPTVKAYEVQYIDDLLFGVWDTYTNVTATPPTTSVELPIGRVDVEFFKVISQ